MLEDQDSPTPGSAPEGQDEEAGDSKPVTSKHPGNRTERALRMRTASFAGCT